MAPELGFLTWYKAKGEHMFEKIVPGNKTYVHFMPPTNKQSSIWKAADEAVSTKFKNMLNIVGLYQWNWDNVLYGHTKHYIGILKSRHVQWVVQCETIEYRTKFLWWNVSAIWRIIHKHMRRPLQSTTKEKQL